MDTWLYFVVLRMVYYKMSLTTVQRRSALANNVLVWLHAGNSSVHVQALRAQADVLLMPQGTSDPASTDPAQALSILQVAATTEP